MAERKKKFREDRFSWKPGDVHIMSDAAIRKAGLTIVTPKPVSKSKTKKK